MPAIVDPCPEWKRALGQERTSHRLAVATRGASGISPFATSSIQSMAASDREKPVGPFWPPHQASDLTEPAARVISWMTDEASAPRQFRTDSVRREAS